MVDFSLAAALHYSAAAVKNVHPPFLLPSLHPPPPPLPSPLRLLYSVLPPSVANELRHKRPVPAKRYDNVSILFSGIVGFNAFCSKHASAEGAIKIVNLLNDVYTRFDILTDSRNNPYVYKVGSRLTFVCTFYNQATGISCGDLVGEYKFRKFLLWLPRTSKALDYVR